MPAPDPPQAAQLLSGHLEALIAAIAEETHLIRSGRVRDGLMLQQQKDEAARGYVAALRSLAGALELPAQAKADLIDRHRALRDLLAENLAVLTTVRSVSETILRETSDMLSSARTSTYGPSSRTRCATPLTLSRST